MNARVIFTDKKLITSGFFGVYSFNPFWNVDCFLCELNSIPEIGI